MTGRGESSGSEPGVGSVHSQQTNSLFHTSQKEVGGGDSDVRVFHVTPTLLLLAFSPESCQSADSLLHVTEWLLDGLSRGFAGLPLE